MNKGFSLSSKERHKLGLGFGLCAVTSSLVSFAFLSRSLCPCALDLAFQLHRSCRLHHFLLLTLAATTPSTSPSYLRHRCTPSSSCVVVYPLSQLSLHIKWWILGSFRLIFSSGVQAVAMSSLIITPDEPVDEIECSFGSRLVLM